MTIDSIQWFGLGLLGLYLAVSELLRVRLVGRPARVTLEAAIDGTRETARRLRMADGEPADALLDDAAETIHRRRTVWPWTGADEAAGWTLLHRAEAMLVPPGRPDLDVAVKAAQDAQERAFDAFVTRQRQSAHLGIVGVGIVGGVVLLGPAFVGVVFVGGLGGFLNAMRRGLRVRSGVVDDGARWGSMLLAPVIGALAAFAGIELVQLGVGVGLLNVPATLTLSNPPTPAVLGLALVFGFAEQFFEAPAEARSSPDQGLAAASDASWMIATARPEGGGAHTVVGFSPVASAPSAVASPPAASVVADVLPDPASPTPVAWPYVPPVDVPPTPTPAPVEPSADVLYVAWPNEPTGSATTEAPTNGTEPSTEVLYVAWPDVPKPAPAPADGPTPPAAPPPKQVAWPSVPPESSPADPPPPAEGPSAGSVALKEPARVDWP